MGTRNLTCVYMDGEYKVAQYGQWDGYPEGQGLTCLHFLRDKVNWLLFTERLKQLEFINPKKVDELFYEFGGSQDGTIPAEKHDFFGKVFPELHRDTGAEILEMIQEDKLITRRVEDNLTFAAQSDCEWCYVVDIDKDTFEVYEGYNTEPLTENDRFYFLRDKEDGWVNFEGKTMHGVKLSKSYDLHNLPTDEEFLKDFEKYEE